MNTNELPPPHPDDRAQSYYDPLADKFGAERRARTHLKFLSPTDARRLGELETQEASYRIHPKDMVELQLLRTIAHYTWLSESMVQPESDPRFPSLNKEDELERLRQEITNLKQKFEENNLT